MNRAFKAPCNCLHHVYTNFQLYTCVHTPTAARFFSKILATNIHTPPPHKAHTARGLISLNVCVCVCVLCIVGVEEGDALKNSSGSTDVSPLSSLSLQTMASAPREPRHWRRRSSATPPSLTSTFRVSVRVVGVYLTGARFFFSLSFILCT